MKFLVVSLASVLMCACASSPKPVAVNQPQALPPTDMELVWNQKLEADHQQTEADKVRLEQQTYEESIAKIEEKFGTERLQILMCTETYGVQSKPCWELLHKFCTIAMFIDSRGDRHNKEYCTAAFLDYHNPNLKH
jgi:hypothetical protein